jgi:hypothetical protein
VESRTAKIALRRKMSTLRVRLVARLAAASLTAFLLTGCAVTPPAQHPKLPPDEQDLANRCATYVEQYCRRQPLVRVGAAGPGLVNDELVKCMTKIMNEYGAAPSLPDKQKVMLRYSCPESMVDPDGTRNAPSTTKSAEGESCTKTADCELGLRCIKLTCVPADAPAHPASKPTSFKAPSRPMVAHGGGLNRCGCHFNRKTGECHKCLSLPARPPTPSRSLRQLL